MSALRDDPGRYPVAELGPHDVVVLPDEYERPVGPALTAARQRSVVAADERLGRLAPGLAGALADGVGPFSWNVAHPEQLWAAVERATAWHHVDGQRLLLDGHPTVHVDRGLHLVRAVADQLAAAVRDGAVVTVTGADEIDDDLGAFAATVERAFGLRARVDLHAVGAALTRPRTGHVTAVIAVDGAVSVHAGTSTSTLGCGDGIVVDGDIDLHVDAPTLVAVVAAPAFAAPSIGELTHGLAVRQPRLRADLPRDLEGPVTSYAGSPLTDSAVRDEELDLLLGTAALARGFAHHLACLPPRYRESLTATMRRLDEPVERWVVRNTLAAGLQVVPGTGDGVELTGASRRMLVDVPAALILAAIAEDRDRPFSALATGGSGTDEATVESVVRAAIATGWCELVGPA